MQVETADMLFYRKLKKNQGNSVHFCQNVSKLVSSQVELQ